MKPVVTKTVVWMFAAMSAASVGTAYAQHLDGNASGSLSGSSSGNAALSASGSNVNMNWSGGGVLSAESTSNASTNQTSTHRRAEMAQSH